MRPKVSIIVTVYNTVKYLQRCLDSIVDQSLDNIEIILVDDGSTDTSKELCDDYAKRYNNIRVIHKKNEGVAFARNSGLDIATGEFVAFVDSDDFVDENMYKDLYETAKILNIKTVFCGYKSYDDKNNIQIKKSPCRKKLYKGSRVFRRALLELVGTRPKEKIDVSLNKSVCFGIYSLDLINKKRIRFYSERKYIAEDLLFNISYFRYADGLYVDEATPYNYSCNKEGLSYIYTKDKFDDYMVMYKKMRRMLRKHKKQKEIKIRMQRTCICYAMFLVYLICNSYRTKKAIKNIKILCSNNNLISLLCDYEYYKCPFRLSISCFLMKRKMAFLIWLIENLSKKIEYLKTIVKIIWIKGRKCDGS